MHFPPQHENSKMKKQLYWKFHAMMSRLGSFCLVQVCRSSFPTLARVECLYICRDHECLWRTYWVDDVPEFHWVELSRLFTATKKLYLSGGSPMYCAHPARACRGKDNRTVTCPAESFFTWLQDMGSYRKSHWRLRCHARALRTSCIC